VCCISLLFIRTRPHSRPPPLFPYTTLFRSERARGGVGLIITGGIAPNSEGVTYTGAAKLTTPEEVAEHKVITDAVHAAGGRIAMQILHTGRYAFSEESVAPSAIQAPINPFTPRALTDEEVERTIEDFVHTAELAREAGYDG